MTTLADILIDFAHDLGQAQIYEASSGTTTTLVNTNTGKEDSELTGWIIITSTTDGAAPQGEFSALSAFDPATGTFTVSDAFTAAVADGDEFAFVTNTYPLKTVIQLVNRGLRRLGPLQGIDTSLTTATDQSEYTVATGLKRGVRGVQIQTNINDSDDNQWAWVHDWYYVPATAGNTGLLIFTRELTTNRTLKVWYDYEHAKLSAYSDVVDERIDSDLATAAALERIYAWSTKRSRGNDSFELQAWNEAKADLEEMKRMYPIARESEPPQRILTIG